MRKVEWVDVTSAFSEEERHYKKTYLELCEVCNDVLELSLFSSRTGDWEIYFSWDIFYGIVYADAKHAVDVREKMKKELETEFRRRKKPSSEFIDMFSVKYGVCIPNDMFFDMDNFFEGFENVDPFSKY